MRILVVTTMWKRHALTDIVFSYYNDLKKYIDIDLLACGSEGNVSRDIAEGNGWNYVEYHNNCLSAKHNFLFKQSEKINHDAVMLIGSDDLVSIDVLKYYKRKIENKNALYGFNKLHFYNIKKDELIYFKGYQKDITKRVTMGAGRLFTKEVLSKINYLPFYGTGINRGLDSRTSKILYNKNIKEIEFDIEQTGGMIVDVKSDVNITDYNRLLVNCNKVSCKLFEMKFPNEYKKIKNEYTRNKACQ